MERDPKETAACCTGAEGLQRALFQRGHWEQVLSKKWAEGRDKIFGVPSYSGEVVEWTSDLHVHTNCRPSLPLSLIKGAKFLSCVGTSRV